MLRVDLTHKFGLAAAGEAASPIAVSGSHPSLAIPCESKLLHVSKRLN
jgi:hypothetical protein